METWWIRLNIFETQRENSYLKDTIHLSQLFWMKVSLVYLCKLRCFLSWSWCFFRLLKEMIITSNNKETYCVKHNASSESSCMIWIKFLLAFLFDRIKWYFNHLARVSYQNRVVNFPRQEPSYLQVRKEPLLIWYFCKRVLVCRFAKISLQGGVCSTKIICHYIKKSHHSFNFF